MFAGGDLIENGAEREKIGAGVELFAASLFRRHVGDGADGEAGAGEVRYVGVVNGGFVALTGDEFRQTEIENFCRTAVGEKNVGGLDVAMDDTFFVRGVERVGELNAEFERAI